MNKNFILVFLMGILANTGFGQLSNAIFFSENGERFFVVVNGLQQNDNPETNVKITGLKPTQYKVKIVFETASFGVIDKNIFLEPNSEFTFQIKKKPDAQNQKDKYVLRSFSVTDEPPSRAPSTGTAKPLAPPPPSYPTQNQVIISFDMDGIGMNMQVNEGKHFHESTTTTTTITTTTQNAPPPPPPAPLPPPNDFDQGCMFPMTDMDFRNAKSSISSKSFEDTKLSVAKQITEANCLKSLQVKEVMELFSFESTRLEFAKFAWDFTFDRKNYFKVNDAFTFESSVDDLNNYIQDRK